MNRLPVTRSLPVAPVHGHESIGMAATRAALRRHRAVLAAVLAITLPGVPATAAASTDLASATWPLVDDDGNPVPSSEEAVPRDALSQTHHGFYLTARQAYQSKRWLGRDVLFIDVRDARGDPARVMPAGVDLVAPVVRRDAGIAPHPALGFVGNVKRVLAARGRDHDALVFVICDNGRESALAAELLAQAGVTRVFLVRGGMKGEAAGPEGASRGWIAAGLPVDPAGTRALAARARPSTGQ